MWHNSSCQVKKLAKRAFLQLLDKDFPLRFIVLLRVLLYNTISVVLVFYVL